MSRLQTVFMFIYINKWFLSVPVTFDLFIRKNTPELFGTIATIGRWMRFMKRNFVPSIPLGNRKNSMVQFRLPNRFYVSFSER